MKTKKNCDICDKTFYIFPSREGKKFTCSKECSMERRKNRKYFNCIECGKEDFYHLSQDKYYKGNGTYCSKKCRYVHYEKNPSKSPAYKNGKSKDCLGYIILSRYRIREHRDIMEKYLGRKLHSNEVVHHIDHNKGNNDISNLQLMSIRGHHKLHDIDMLRDNKGRFLRKKFIEEKM